MSQRNAGKRVRTLASILRQAERLSVVQASNDEKTAWDSMVGLDRLFWDECLMQHAGVVWLILNILKPKKFIPLGDPVQTAFTSNFADIGNIQFNLLLSTKLACQNSVPGIVDFDVSRVVTVSYRYGPTTCHLVAPFYQEMYGSRFVPKSLRDVNDDTTFEVIGTQDVLLDNKVKSYISKFNEAKKSVLVMGLTHASTRNCVLYAHTLAGNVNTKIDPKKLLTVKAAQGADADLALIVRVETKDIPIIKADDILNVALTRSKRHTVYVTKCQKEDRLGSLITLKNKEIQTQPQILQKYVAGPNDKTTSMVFNEIFGPLKKETPTPGRSRQPEIVITGTGSDPAWTETIAGSATTLITEHKAQIINVPTTPNEVSKKKIKKPMSFAEMTKLPLYDSAGNRKLYTIKKEMYRGRDEERVYEELKKKAEIFGLRKHFIFREPTTEVQKMELAVREVSDRLAAVEPLGFSEKTVRTYIRLVDSNAFVMPLLGEPDTELLQSAINKWNPNGELKRIADELAHECTELHSPVFLGKVGDANSHKKDVSGNYECVLDTPMARPSSSSSYIEMLRPVIQRNMEAPDLKDGHVLSEIAGWELFSTFRETYFGNKTPPPVVLNHEMILEWHRRTGAETEKVLYDYWFEVASVILRNYQLMIKNNAKPAVEQEKNTEYDNPQVITLCHKAMIHVFGPIFMQMFDWILGNLPPNILVNNGVSVDDLEVFFETHLPTDNFSDAFELDIKRYDKSQVEDCMGFELHMFKWFGVPDYLIELWHITHSWVKLYSRLHFFEMMLGFQRRTGDAGTFPLNTFINMALTARAADVRFSKLLVFAGDDVWGTGMFVKPDLHDIYAKIYNFEIKELHLNHIYICGKFIVDDGFHRRAMPNPMNALWKCGRQDVYTEDMLREICRSYRDNFKRYDNEVAVEILEKHVIERYGKIFPVKETCVLLKNMVKDEETFLSYYTAPTNPRTMTTHNKLD